MSSTASRIFIFLKLCLYQCMCLEIRNAENCEVFSTFETQSSFSSKDFANLSRI